MTIRYEGRAITRYNNNKPIMRLLHTVELILCLDSLQKSRGTRNPRQLEKPNQLIFGGFAMTKFARDAVRANFSRKT